MFAWAMDGVPMEAVFHRLRHTIPDDATHAVVSSHPFSMFSSARTLVHDGLQFLRVFDPSQLTLALVINYVRLPNTDVRT